ncbi:hypothetical protein SISNIDRAFT_267492 [Sistotremastrum niveocremeum HHB9708]|uniref:Uncharacterized protein n=1 Tax=Sistotremastrum niveocremeum HHB9708 TaxID=1314777 RepID=A0A164NY21_9AGAM|nr:hypothetical protein SISNIDRAFT_267492 [Sistotremastrum niveocremeum HHB9708]
MHMPARLEIGELERKIENTRKKTYQKRTLRAGPTPKPGCCVAQTIKSDGIVRALEDDYDHLYRIYKPTKLARVGWAQLLMAFGPASLLSR